MGVIKRGDVWYVKWKVATGWRRQATTARTKAEAQVLFAELVRQASRQKLGLEAQPLQTGMSLWALCEWWLEQHVSAASLRRYKSMLHVHIEQTALGPLPLSAVGHNVLTTYFRALQKNGYAPRTVNVLRANLRSAFTSAKKAGLWVGENPVGLTDRLEVVESPRPTFTPSEVELIIENAPMQWQPFFACASYLGLRKGELCGLRKEDYDAGGRTLFVGRSYEAQQTKGKRHDVLPAPKALVPWLEIALKTAGPFMFPGPGGKMRGQWCEPEEILRSSMRRAGLVDGWLHKCRWCVREKRKSVYRFNDSDQRRCPECERKLLPVGIPKSGMVFHDFRHTTATLLLKSGVPIQHVQRIMRHSSITTTVNTYGHLVTEDLRSAVDRLGPRPVQVLPLRRIT